ncbi:MAG: cell wall anchor protein [Parascardovia denticolens]
MNTMQDSPGPHRPWSRENASSSLPSASICFKDRRRVFRWAATACLCLVALVLSLMTIPTHFASAASGGTLAHPGGRYLTVTVDGKLRYLGVIARDKQGRNAYCIEEGVDNTYVYSDTKTMPDSPQLRKVAYLAQKYQASTDKMTQTAIGILVKDNFEARDMKAYRKIRAAFLKKYPQLEGRIASLWAEARAADLSNLAVTNSYTDSFRAGEFHLRVLDSTGKPVPGLPVTVHLEGPGTFNASGTKELKVTTAANPIDIPWTATGQGPVSLTTSFAPASMEKLVSAQDYLRMVPGKERILRSVSFQVRKSFLPTIHTLARPNRIEQGRTVSDQVTMTTGQGQTWPQGVSLTAQGYYFTNLTAEQIHQKINPQERMTAGEYLKELSDKGLRPSGYATAVFTGSGQTKTVTALTSADAKTARTLVTPAGACFGTWVWMVDRAQQNQQAQSFLEKDVLSDFLDAQETVSQRARLSVDSTVSEHTAIVGAQLTDRITIAGFPADHGSFAGDARYGFGADDKYAQVKVYWAGSNRDGEDDAAFKPSGDLAPQADKNHELVGQWTYPARNGSLKVGGGSPDAFGKPVNIKAKKHGYYVFVYTFAGDDRVSPAHSSYGDEWEMTRVYDRDKPQPERVTVTTQVSTEKVETGQPYFDKATVTGHVEQGAYVTFTVYEAVPSGKPDVSARKLLDEARVPIDMASCAREGSAGRKNDDIMVCTVTSPQARSAQAGVSYWKATVWSAQGRILASHELGAKHEQVTVGKPPVPTQPVPGQPQSPHQPQAPQQPSQPQGPRTPSQPALAKTGSAVAYVGFIGLSLALLAALLLMAGHRMMRRMEEAESEVDQG